ncbi:FRG domain-containing protein [Pigmentibacter sp. JX0631]|uniref:FRG domain-containing protein n=1 Tax=Pigmentibacter sp. JX0631 TaxID=2976982 RepID=UPI00246880E7|nr:FRG domain-containing protein [Pigmentibacter sp. JX0631]WGL59783.1 FRG domain-containing protein [Pigmentibacter sp. JX0631]
MENVLRYLELISKYNENISDELIRNSTINNSPEKKQKNKFYFRGQSNCSWKLIPSIFRQECVDYDEAKLIKSVLKFKYSHFDIDDIGLNTILQKTLELQHYHMPTRLLDWSENPLVALYFAACNDNNKDGTIFLLYNLQEKGNEKLAKLNDFNFRLKLKISIMDNKSSILKELNNEYNKFKELFKYNNIDIEKFNKEENSNQNNDIFKFSKEVMRFKKVGIRSLNRNLTTPLTEFVTDQGSVFSLEDDCEILKEIQKRISFIYKLNEASIIKYRETDRGKNQSSIFTMHFGKIIDNKIIIPYDLFEENKRLENKVNKTDFQLDHWNGSNLLVAKILLRKEDKSKIIYELRKYFGIHDAFIYPDDKKRKFDYLYQEFICREYNDTENFKYTNNI